MFLKFAEIKKKKSLLVKYQNQKKKKGEWADWA
jgi:hypothetical protein